MKFMKKTRKILIAALIAIFVVCAVPASQILGFDFGFSDVDAATVIYSGSVNSKVNYAIDGNYQLTISGSGAMTDYTSSSESPWESYKDDILSIVIEDGVTSVGAMAFYACQNVTEVTIGDDVTMIGEDAFCDNISLTDVVFGDSVAGIGAGAFAWCEALESLSVASSLVAIGENAFYDCDNLKYIFYAGSDFSDISIHTNGNSSFSEDLVVYEFTTYQPQFSSSSTTTSSITLNWTSVEGANGYYVYQVTDGEATKIQTLSSTSYTVTGLNSSTSYVFVVQAYNSQGLLSAQSESYSVSTTFDSCASGHTGTNWETTLEATATTTGIETGICEVCGAVVTREIACLAPSKVSSITVENGSTWLTLSWEADTGATGYQIYMNDTKIATLYEGETTYKVTDLDGATDYDFYIRSFSKETGSAVFGTYSETYTFTTNPFKASFVSYSCTCDAIRVNWNAVDGADGYRIYQLIDGKWVSLETVSSSTLTYRISELEAGTEYSFKVKAYTRDTDGVAQFGVASNEYVTSTKTTQVQMSSYSNTTSAIRINWDSVSVADGYRIYQYIDGKWVTLATVSSSTLTYRISGLDDGTIYKFKVKAYIRDDSGTAVWQDSSDTFVTMTDLSTAKIISASKTSSAIRINWDDVDGATGYKVYMLVDGKWITYDTIYEGDITTYRISGLDSNTTYQFKICAFSKETGSTVWGTTSSIYKVTTN